MEILKLLAALIVLGVFLYRRINLGYAMTAAAVTLGILYQLPVDKWLQIITQTVTTIDNLRIVAALYLIMALENILRKSGALDRLMKACRVLIPDARLTMAMLPAFMGFLPSLGGAIFSAPMVDEAAEGHNLSAERKFMINYWFRHVWEYFLPIYPSILLASTILSIPERQFILHFSIFALLSIILGFIVCFRGVKSIGNATLVTEEKAKRAYVSDLFFALSPVLVMLALVIIIKMEVTLAVALVLACLLLYYRYNPAQFRQLLVGAFNKKLMLSVLGVLFFKEVLMQSGSVNDVVGLFKLLGISSVMLIGSMSLVLGMLTGMPQAIIGIVFPLILGYPQESHLYLAMIGIVFGTAGQMVSPMHLCLVVTQEFFQSQFIKVLPRLIIMQAIIMSVACLIYYME